MRVDAVVLDIDGVIVDVSDSYRRAIVETVERIYGETVPRSAVQAFKDAGGFNNDWELTDAVAIFVLARRAGLEDSVGAFTDAVHDDGGGLAAAKGVLRDRLPDGDDVLEAWDPTRIRAVFQALYLGSDLYRELEGGEPPFDAPGYIHDEPVIIQPETWSWLTDRFAVGILTGRPADEADIALDHAGIEVPTDHRVTMDDDHPGKPAPAGLLSLADRLESTVTAFVGDTLDDVRTVIAAEATDGGGSFEGIGVLTGGLTGEEGRRVFEEVGADAVVPSVNDLPDLLEPR